MATSAFFIFIYLMQRRKIQRDMEKGREKGERRPAVRAKGGWLLSLESWMGFCLADTVSVSGQGQTRVGAQLSLSPALLNGA